MTTSILLIETRKHSSRMYTAFLETVCAPVSVAKIRCCSRGYSTWPFRGGYGTLPCDLCYDAFDVKYPLYPCEQTDACENITFSQTCLRAVKMPICESRRQFLPNHNASIMNRERSANSSSKFKPVSTWCRHIHLVRCKFFIIWN